jgi:multidrug efflux pump
VNLSRIFILRPVATSLLTAGTILVGIVAFRQLPVSALPEVEYPTIQVQTFFPGASPEVMATSVTAPLERQFGQAPGLAQMTSISSFGNSTITLQFTLEMSIDVAEQEVQAAINAAATFLPPDLPTPPVYSKINPADAPILTLALTSPTLPLPEVEDLAETRFAQRISQAPGVGLVSISGGQRPAVRVRANPTQLASYGMSLEDLRTALGTANVNQAKGSLDGPQQSWTILANDQLLSADQYRNLVIAYRNGGPVRLSDVAEVVDGAENSQQAAWMNQTPAVILNIRRQPGTNTIQVVDGIQRILPALRAALPANVQVYVLANRTTSIRASVRDVEDELLVTVGLVVLVIFLFLRTASATVIPSVAVPLSLIATFAVMYLLGYSLDNLSLMALTISTGFVVDDAIVMIENITRYIEMGEQPLQAALKGSAEIGFTIVSLTVSLVAVLIPLLFMGEIIGRLFREFAVTLAVTIIMSLLISLTLTPMMCSRLLQPLAARRPGRLYQLSERFFDATIQTYGRALRAALRRQTLTVLAAGAALLVTIALFWVIPKGFFPVQDTGQILGITQGPQSISFASMSQRQQQLAAVILQDPAVENLASFIGVDGTNLTPNTGRFQITLKPLEERGVSAGEVIRRIQLQLERAPGMHVFLQPVQNLSVESRASATQYQYSLEAPGSPLLSQWAPRLLARLRTLPELTDVASDLFDNGRGLLLTIDRDTAGRLGISPQRIDDTLYDAFGERQVSTIFTQLNQYHVILETDPRWRQFSSSLNTIYLPGANGQAPLRATTWEQQVSTPVAINHQGQFPAVTFSFNLAPRVSLGAAVQAIKSATRQIQLPPAIVANFQGTAAAFEASLAHEPVLILAAILTVYIVLGVLYESYIHPITILSTLPSAGVGALIALMLTGQDFNILSLIGMILLIGIVKKNAIMMIDFALEAQRTAGMAPQEAIYHASLLRFRPIMMTTMAALLGAVPLALGKGMGSELRRPLGITIIGGLLLSQLLTLFTTPAIYLQFEHLGERFRHRQEAKQLTLPLEARDEPL